jgi:hypothetical protein
VGPVNRARAQSVTKSTPGGMTEELTVPDYAVLREACEAMVFLARMNVRGQAIEGSDKKRCVYCDYFPRVVVVISSSLPPGS